MSVQTHKKYPTQLLEYITRRYNGVVGLNFIKVKSNSIELQFENHVHADYTVIANLLTKLATSFKNIERKYISQDEKHHHSSVKLDEDEISIKLKISGTLYIPTTKFLKIYGMILWYYIRYKTGTKPNDSILGRKLVTDWKNEEKTISREINRLPRKKISAYESKPCHICGDQTNLINVWRFNLAQDKFGTDIETPVCQKHESRLI